MKLRDCYVEEDLFPKIFTKYEERDYGILFYNTENKDSFDSNHAVIYKDKIQDLQQVLADIVRFYKTKGIRPIIYQSMLDDNWFDEIKGGFRHIILTFACLMEQRSGIAICGSVIMTRLILEGT